LIHKKRDRENEFVADTKFGIDNVAAMLRFRL